jgi:hypothetical protein
MTSTHEFYAGIVDGSGQIGGAVQVQDRAVASLTISSDGTFSGSMGIDVLIVQTGSAPLQIHASPFQISGSVGTAVSEQIDLGTFEGVDYDLHLNATVTQTGTQSQITENDFMDLSGSKSGAVPITGTLKLSTPTQDAFTRYGNSDILFSNQTSGDTGVYAIDPGISVGWQDIGFSSTAYSVVGTGDFNGDLTTDVLFRNNTTGDTGFYKIVNGTNAGWNDVGASSIAYSVAGVGDFNGDGVSDILYRNNLTGDTGFYAIVNGANTGWHDVGASSTAYSVVSVGDFNGDGTSDILYRNNITGDTGFYAIVGGVNQGWNDVGASSTAYHVAG